MGPLELRTMQGAVGARSSPPTIGNLFIALMTPWWIHLETDLLMSGDGAGTAPREACRASSPGGAKGVWSETGRAGKGGLGSVWENHSEIFCFSIPIGLLRGVMRRQSGGRSHGLENGRLDGTSHSSLRSKLLVTLTKLSKLPGPQCSHLSGKDTQIMPAVSPLSQGVGRIR